MNKTVSPYKLGWIGLRALRRGQSTKILKSDGWINTCRHAQDNNRNAFDFIIPCKTEADFKKMNWKPLVKAGFSGIAIWFTDAQWGKNAGITDHQWQQRIIIE